MIEILIISFLKRTPRMPMWKNKKSLVGLVAYLPSTVILGRITETFLRADKTDMKLELDKVLVNRIRIYSSQFISSSIIAPGRTADNYQPWLPWVRL